jgi:hypothetical protein
MGSNPTQGMDDCVCVVRGGLATGCSPIRGVLPTVSGLRNWSETKRFTDALSSKWDQQEREVVTECGNYFSCCYYKYLPSWVVQTTVLKKGALEMSLWPVKFGKHCSDVLWQWCIVHHKFTILTLSVVRGIFKLWDASEAGSASTLRCEKEKGSEFRPFNIPGSKASLFLTGSRVLNITGRWFESRMSITLTSW